jgi:hypothetical protein
VDGPSLELLIDLESQVWDALVRGDPDADRRLLADDFVGVYPTGFADRTDHADQLAGGPTISSFEIVEPRAVPLTPSSALLCYRARYRRARSGGESREEVMFVSSLWLERAGAWVNVFSQDTPARPG